MATFAETAQLPFDLCGGHPALDFVNSLDDRFDAAGAKELLTDYGALLRFAGEAGLLNATQARGLARAAGTPAAAKVLRSALELRESMAAVLYAGAEHRTPAAADVAGLERCLLEVEQPRQLQWAGAQSADQSSLQWHWRDAQVKAAGFPLWLVAHAASQLMLSNAFQRVRACEADSCRWLFLDMSKNHTRRWCNMKVCGNRAKARRFQERRT